MAEKEPEKFKAQPATQQVTKATRSTGQYLFLGLLRVLWSSKIVIILSIIMLVSALATYRYLTGQDMGWLDFLTSIPILESLRQHNTDSDTQNIIPLIYINMGLFLALAAAITYQLAAFWIKRRRGWLGTKLHLKMIAAFSMVAMLPIMIMAISTAFFFHYGVESWFSDRVQTAIDGSSVIADAYLEEHQRGIESDGLIVLNEINDNALRYLTNTQDLSEALNQRIFGQNLSEIVVFDNRSQTIAKAGLTFSMELEVMPQDVIERAKAGEIVLLTNESDDRVRAVMWIKGWEAWGDYFLLVGRIIDPEVLAYRQQVSEAAAEFTDLEKGRSQVELLIAIIYAGLSLALLLLAMAFGASMAERIATPIGRFISAAELVRAGDLSARLSENTDKSDLQNLARAFNRMTSQLDNQRKDLIEANKQLDLRSKFTETVLAGVSSGVLGLDAKGKISLANHAALQLLNATDEAEITDKSLETLIPESAAIMAKTKSQPTRIQKGEIQLKTEGKAVKRLHINIEAELRQNEILGYVVTFDDVTDLLQAQRTAAWADVAQRIAHEIKNPLTPIQISAERLKRKYLKEISSDTETFETCVDTIVRQVGGIRGMVNEFSDFARMPTPVVKAENIGKIMGESIFLNKQAFPKIDFNFTPPKPEEPPIMAICDSRLISQAFTNILKNASESIIEKNSEKPSKGKIIINIEKGKIEDNTENMWSISIIDNGTGLPKEKEQSITEPYVTTKKKGTGLGLAIVKKIMEDHNGDFSITNHKENKEIKGAIVKLRLPISPQKKPY